MSASEFTVPLDALKVAGDRFSNVPAAIFGVLFVSVFVQIALRTSGTLALFTLVGLAVSLVLAVASSLWFGNRYRYAFAAEVLRLGGIAITLREAKALMRAAEAARSHGFQRDQRDAPPQFSIVVEQGRTITVECAPWSSYLMRVTARE